MQLVQEIFLQILKVEVKMLVYEITLKIFFIKDIPIPLIYGELTKYIDSYLAQNQCFLDLHKRRSVKGYCFDLPVRIENGMIAYRSGQIYQFRIRTVYKELLSYLMDGIADHKTDAVKGLTRTVKQIPRRSVSSVWTLTPVVLINANDKGYWRDCMSFEEFEQDLKAGLIHQYEMYTGEKITGQFPLYDQIELQSKCAIGVPYKGITLLGDKLSMQVSEHENAQKIIYFALANGMGVKGTRGFGFLGYRFG